MEIERDRERDLERKSKGDRELEREKCREKESSETIIPFFFCVFIPSTKKAYLFANLIFSGYW